MVTEAEDRECLEKMTMKELRVIEKEEFFVTSRARSRKADLINAIVEWRRLKRMYMECQ